MKLNRPAILDWVKDLRSGKYVQGKGFLKQKGVKEGEVQYCCLGVVCEGRVKWDEMNSCVFGARPLAADGHYTSTSFLPHQVQSLIGLSTARESKLARANDAGKSFEEIAQMLEAWLAEEELASNDGA